MQMSHKPKRPIRLILFFTVLVSIIIIDACRKPDFEAEADNPDKPTTVDGITKKFFTVPVGTNEKVKAMAAVIQRENEKRHFVEALVKKAGYPRWDKAIIEKVNKKIGIQTEDGDDDDEEEEEKTAIYVPFTLSNSTAAVLTVAINVVASRDTAYKLLFPQDALVMGFDTANVIRGAHAWSARNLFAMFAKFDYDIYETDSFTVYDGRILAENKTDTLDVKLHLENGIGRAGNGGYQTETWTTVCVMAEHWKKCFRMAGRSQNGVTTESESTYWTNICNSFYYDGGTGGGPGPLDPDGGGGGGGPMGAGDWDEEPVCPALPRGGIGTDFVVITDPCDPLWIPLNGDPWADYLNWGYHHFETLNVSPEDEDIAEDWAVNNIDTTGLDPCVRSILDDLLGGPSLIGRILTKLDRAANRPSDIEKYRLKFRTGPLPQGVGARTKTGSLNPANGIYSDTITINNTGILDSSTQVATARNIVHEIVHAYMNSIFKRHYNFANPELIPQDIIWDDYIDTLVAIQRRDSLYNWYISDPAGNFDHNYMAEKLLGIMAAALAIVDDGRNSDEFYWGVCWGGLFGTRPMRQAWPNYPSWPPTAGAPAPSNDSTRGLKYALTQARLDSISDWVNNERWDTTKAKGRRRQSTGCYGN